MFFRQPENSTQVLESDGAQLIITAQTRHPENR